MLSRQRDGLLSDGRGEEGQEASVGLDAEGWDSEGDVPLQTEEDFEELDPEEFLEELEELEPDEILEDIEPEELSEELELISDPEPIETSASQVANQEKTGSESLGSELRDLLSGLESFPGPAMNVRDELEEAEFYLQQGLLDDAERVCKRLLDFDPGCAAALRKLSELALLRQEAVSAPAERELFDLAGSMPDEEAWRQNKEMQGLNDADRPKLVGIANDFNNNAASVIDAEDTETHYNLGIAYKEMGLFDDAVAEFEKAMTNPGRLVDSLTLKGTCLVEMGSFDQAEEIFKSGLVYPGLNTAERISLHYELGLLYEAWGRPLEALDSYQSAADADLFFRNVGEKIEALRKNLGLDANTGKEDPGIKGNRSRVSYI
jgi:tetratricopeptide (TPR) repeat protein